MIKYIIGNLKMNLLTVAERDHYLKSFVSEFGKINFSESKLVICPPFLHAEKFVEILSNSKISIGLQDVYFEERGSFTGEISPLMAKNFGMEFVLIGHSERRKYFGETDEICNMKIRAALKENLRPVFCVGETLEDRENDLTFQVISKQIEKGFQEIINTQVDKVLIAYEPVWAVGSDVVPNSDEIMQVKILIRKKIAEMYSLDLAEKVPILYGGSVKSKIVQQVCLEPEMNGVLIGRESLIASEFLKIAQIIDKN